MYRFRTGAAATLQNAASTALNMANAPYYLLHGRPSRLCSTARRGTSSPPKHAQGGFTAGLQHRLAQFCVPGSWVRRGPQRSYYDTAQNRWSLRSTDKRTGSEKTRNKRNKPIASRGSRGKTGDLATRGHYLSFVPSRPSTFGVRYVINRAQSQ